MPSLIVLVRAAMAPSVVMEDVVPRPERLEAEGLGALGVGVERLDVRHFTGADEVPDGKPELGHVNLLSL